MPGIVIFARMNGKTIPSIAWFCFTGLLLACGGLYAQNGGNPFDLTPRLPEEAVASEAPQIPDAAPANPFDIAAPPADAAVIAPSGQAKQTAVSAPSSPTPAGYSRFLFTVVILLFVLLVILVTLYRSIPGRVYRAFLNDNLLSQLHREQGAIVSPPYFLFYLFFFFNAGFFLYLLTWHYQIPVAGRHWLSFLALTGGLTALYTAKHLLMKILEAVLPPRREIRLYSFTIIIFSIAIGFLLIPFNLLIAYGPVEAVPGVITMAIAMLGLALGFRFVRGIFIGGRILASHLFHFLLYICTVEIAPALIIAKTIMLAVANN